MPKISDNYENRSEIEVSIGRNIRKLRTFKGYSQIKIAKAIGVTFQQFQKYECGMNRLCVSRLIDICNFCNISLSEFFGMLFNQGSALQEEESSCGFQYEYSNNKETLSLIRYFNGITNSLVRERIFSLMKALAKTATEEEKDEQK